MILKSKAKKFTNIKDLFHFFGKGLGIDYPLLFHVTLTDQISLSDCICFWEILDNMFIAIACFPGCDVINFEINLIFLTKAFFYVTKKLRQKIVKNCLSPDSALLNSQYFKTFG